MIHIYSYFLLIQSISNNNNKKFALTCQGEKKENFSLPSKNC